MRTDGALHRFGSFELHSDHRRLMRGLERVRVPDPQARMLLLFVNRPGEVLSIDALAHAGWDEPAVNDNTVVQALARLRRTLGCQPDGTPFFENVSRRGYRFLAPVARDSTRHANVDIDALLAPYAAFAEGNAALDTLDLDEIGRARTAFEEALRAAPDDPAAHIGLANACLLMFESTRIDTAPDVASLQLADCHAERACRIDPTCGAAWSALAFVFSCKGDVTRARAAADRAIRLEPIEWRHHVSLGSVSWGGQRLLAARRVLALYPGLAFAHWFGATVYIARQLFDHALEELRAGCAAQDDQRQQTNRFNTVGVHLLHALVLAARGRDDDALEELSRELACEGQRHVYARECAANSRYTQGAIHLRNGRREAAAASFRRALAHVAGHGPAAVGLAAATAERLDPRPSGAGNAVDAAVIAAAGIAVRGEHAEAARLCHEALSASGLLSAGWIIPVDPLLNASARPDVWARTLALVRHRAA